MLTSTERDDIRHAERAIPVLTGPTAVGKTSLSLEVAERLGAEIISADSRQVYRALTIGTAKPSPDELARVPHHFINELPLDASFSAGRFAESAWARIHEIVERGAWPLVVGGSTLYLHALIHGLAHIPDVPLDVRQAVEQELDERGSEALYARLQEIDPAAAATMDATKTQRVVRALEVFQATGRPISFYQSQQPDPPFKFRVLVLDRDRAELYARINRRVDAMLEAGLVDEVRGLLGQGAAPSHQALRTIGYQEVLAYLKGRIAYPEMVRLLKRNSRRYAKRQLTWFRRYEDMNWVQLPCSATDVLFLLQ